MEDHTLATFNRWDEIEDYESDENTVSLIDANGEKVAEYNFYRFTQEDFDKYKRVKS